MNDLAHFAIHADNVNRTKQFYESVFSWKCETYGDAQDFLQIRSAEGKVLGAIQSRRYNPGKRDLLGFECSINVDDVEATARAVEAAGGTILMRKTAIPHVGWIVKFSDTEGNLCCAVNYDSAAS
jgi:predicted enzyme related to lactoylglutathione lyase